MSKILDWIAIGWPKLPKQLRAALIAALLLAVIVSASVATNLAWKSGYLPAKFDEILTTKTSKLQNDTLQDNLAVQNAAAIQEALNQYDANIRLYLSTERQLAVDTSFKPAVQLLYALKDEVRRIKNDLKITNDKINDIPNEDKLKQFIQDNNDKDRTAEMLDLILRQQQEQKAANEAIQRSLLELQPHKRTSKVKL